MATRAEATIEDLYHVDAKRAELVNGEILVMPPAGVFHGYAAGRILVRIVEYADRTHSGYGLPDSVAYVVNLPHRRSFCPDAAFIRGPLSAKFHDGAPVFAVEVRSAGDYGPAAERAMAAKRADYFAAGTLVVWDVDVLRDQLVRVYRSSDPADPRTYRRGDVAEAEPALPEWSMPVDDFLPR